MEFIAFLILFFWVFNLNSRVNKNKYGLADLKNVLYKKDGVENDQTTVGTAPSPENQITPQGDQNIYINNNQGPVFDKNSSTAQDVPTDPILKFFSENLILKIGVIMVLIGFGWFVRYAFVHNWIGPFGRIALGLVSGAILSFVGSWRIQKNSTQGQSLLILGSTIMLITITAARFVYEFAIFSPLFTLICVFVVASYVTLVSLKYDKIKLAIVGIIMASIAPILSYAGTSDYVLRLLYIGVVSLSAVWIMFYKNWRGVGAMAALSVLLYSINFNLFGYALDEKYTLIFIAYALSMVFLVTSIFAILRYKDESNGADIFLAIVNSILIMFWTLAHLPKELQSLSLIFWTIIFALGAFVVFKNTQRPFFFYLYSLVSIVYLVVVTSIELNGPTLIFTLIFESAIISISGYLLTQKTDIGKRLSLLLALPVVLSLESFGSRKWISSFWHEDFAVIFVVGIVLIGIGLFYYFAEKEDAPSRKFGESFNYNALLIIGGSVYLYILIWLTLHSMYKNSAVAVMISLVIYTIVGILAYVWGKMEDRRIVRIYGATLLGLVVLRLVLVDAWNMELATRIVTFILIGVFFVSSAFIGGSKKIEINNEV